jgi:hypothetical protein
VNLNEPREIRAIFLEQYFKILEDATRFAGDGAVFTLSRNRIKLNDRYPDLPRRTGSSSLMDHIRGASFAMEEPLMPKIKGVAHFRIPVSDVDKSTKF